MAISVNLLALAILASPLARAGVLDNGNLYDLVRRADYYGGFALGIPPPENCPAGTVACGPNAAVDSGGPCCPSGTFCDPGGNYCCPTSADCSSKIMSDPTCADPSWVLFTAGAGDGTGVVEGICCPVGMVVDEGAECATPNGKGGVESAIVTAINTGFTTQSPGNNASPPPGTVNQAAATGSPAAATGGSSAATGGSSGASASTPTGGATAGTAPTQTTAPSATTTAKKSNGNKLAAVGGFMGLTITLCALFI